jgi:Domain of unknown function (DUF5666)
MRKLIPILLLIATTATAQVRTRAITPPKGELSGNTVTGVVSSVTGSLVRLADGLVVIDTTGAKISGEITPGALLFAVLKPGNVAANAPLPASYVAVTRSAQVTLSGTVTAVDLTARTLTLLGRTMRVTPQTAFSSAFPTFKAIELSDIVTGQPVVVESNASAGALVASSVFVLGFHPPTLPTVIHGTVRSIANDSWVISAGGKDVMVKVDAKTKIAGNPKVGDTVDVLVDADNLALAIIKMPFK